MVIDPTHDAKGRTMSIHPTPPRQGSPPHPPPPLLPALPEPHQVPSTRERLLSWTNGQTCVASTSLHPPPDAARNGDALRSVIHFRLAGASLPNRTFAGNVTIPRGWQLSKPILAVIATAIGYFMIQPTTSKWIKPGVWTARRTIIPPADPLAAKRAPPPTRAPLMALGT